MICIPWIDLWSSIRTGLATIVVFSRNHYRPSNIAFGRTISCPRVTEDLSPQYNIQAAGNINERQMSVSGRCCVPSVVGNFFLKALIRSPLHASLGSSFTVITVRGCTSGRKLQLPVNVAVQKDGSLLVISMRSRSWGRNLQADPRAFLHTAGKDQEVLAEIVDSPDQVADGLAKFFAQYPAYEKYYAVPVVPDGRPDPDALRRVAGERDLIRLRKS